MFYLVVAEFIVQSESTENISEALSIISSWNPTWQPRFFLTDYSDAEMCAVEKVFPATQLYLCEFHREQHWERWVKERSHGLKLATFLNYSVIVQMLHPTELFLRSL